MSLKFDEFTTTAEITKTFSIGTTGGSAVNNIEDGSGENSLQGKIQPGKETFNTNVDGLVHNSGAFGDYSILFGGVGDASGKRSAVFGGYNVATGNNTLATGEATKATQRNATTFGSHTQALAEESIASGINTIANGLGSHTEGQNTKTLKEYKITYTPGVDPQPQPEPQPEPEPTDPNIVNGYNTHAEGASTIAFGQASHSEGSNTRAYGKFSHSEGYLTVAGNLNMSEVDNPDGTKTRTYTQKTFGDHAEGYETQALGGYSHAEGHGTIANQPYQHVSGVYNQNKADTLFEVGNGITNELRNNAFEVYRDGHVEIQKVDSDKNNSVANIGYVNDYINNKLKNPNFNSITTGSIMIGEEVIGPSTAQATKAITSAVSGAGGKLYANGIVTEIDAATVLTTKKYVDEHKGSEVSGATNYGTGNWTTITINGETRPISCVQPATGDGAVDLIIDGRYYTLAGDKLNKKNPTGTGSFSLNRKAGTTIGENSFAEGSDVTASGKHSHSEGTRTDASGESSHAEGWETKATALASHVGGESSTANARCSFVHGYNVVSPSSAPYGISVFGRYNDYRDMQSALFVVGNGTNDTNRSNALKILNNGDAIVQNNLQIVNGNLQIGNTTITETQLQKLLSLLNYLNEEDK